VVKSERGRDRKPVATPESRRPRAEDEGHREIREDKRREEDHDRPRDHECADLLVIAIAAVRHQLACFDSISPSLT
jgi:hypothetical protein